MKGFFFLSHLKNYNLRDCNFIGDTYTIAFTTIFLNCQESFGDTNFHLRYLLYKISVDIMNSLKVNSKSKGHVIVFGGNNSRYRV